MWLADQVPGVDRNNTGNQIDWSISVSICCSIVSLRSCSCKVWPFRPPPSAASDLTGTGSDPAKPGRKARHDYEYERNGVANLFMVFAPLEGWRHVTVTDRHTAIDYAHSLRDLSDVHFPDAAKILLVQDNL